jgi:YcaO-like protein with predicted kinase domain
MSNPDEPRWPDDGSHDAGDEDATCDHPMPSPRQASAVETLARISPYLERYDIHGAVDHTPPDMRQIRSFEILRERPSTGYLNLGKGFGRDAALISGYMEAIEMCTIERVPEIDVVAAGEIEQSALVYTGPESSVQTPSAVEPSRLLVRGADLLYGSEIYVPCDHLFLPSDGGAPNPRLTTNGLASGNTLAEAQLHAVYELIERHLLVVAARQPDTVARVRFEGMPAWLVEGVADVESAGLDVEFFDLGRLYDVSVYQCAVVERRSSASEGARIHFGWGAHYGAAVAAGRGLCEAVQALSIRRACYRGDIPACRLGGGMIIGEEELLRLRSPSSPGEEMLYARLSRAPEAVVQLGGYEATTLGVDEALNRVQLMMVLSGVPRLLCWALSPSRRPFVVVRCEVPGLKSDLH